jgi:pimeloyl-ACP methyl ester carboxylesterase
MPTSSRRAAYGRRPPLVLVSGLAEPAESWYANADAWRGHFDVHQPTLLAYGGRALHRRLDAGLPVDVDFLVRRLYEYLDRFVQAPPYHLVANSLGGKVAVELAVRHPEIVDRLVLLCPSGLSDDERLPVVAGVRRTDPHTLVASVFHDASRADAGLVGYYGRQLGDRYWKAGLLHAVRGTRGHRVRHLLPRLDRPTLLVVGREDRIVDPRQVIEAAALLPRGRLVVLDGCGHAPQIERADVVNQLVIDFLARGEAAAAP